MDEDATSHADAQVDAASLYATPSRGILAKEEIPKVFFVPGTAVGEIPRGSHWDSGHCAGCHSTGGSAPHDTWKGSLMANAGRDPLFLAQVATANQDVPGVGYYCLRCHVPNSVITGNAYDPTGDSLDDFDRDGINCHFCHSMIDPVGFLGATEQARRDEHTLQALTQRPMAYGNAMFVLAPGAERRGPLDVSQIPVMPHEASFSAFYWSSNLCGTCHDVGNPALIAQPDGSYALGALDATSDNPDPAHQFPLERTYTEWKLSEFAKQGVDMQGRFGGDRQVVRTCQDCHMPSGNIAVCSYSAPRAGMRKHEFAGAASWVLKIIALNGEGDPSVDQDALVHAQELADGMLKRAVSLEASRAEQTLQVRVINESGHKFPTGHIEGRRGWVSVLYLDAAGQRVQELGGYDQQTGELDEAHTTVFEMHVGLSEAQAARFGLPAGVTTHMSLADRIEKDTRIPPRGFDRAAFAAAGAPAVRADYQDGQHWADLTFPIPASAEVAEVTAYYQIVTPHYIETLRDANTTNHWGKTLADLWERTDRAPPIPIATARVQLR